MNSINQNLVVPHQYYNNNNDRNDIVSSSSSGSSRSSSRSRTSIKKKLNQNEMHMRPRSMSHSRTASSNSNSLSSSRTGTSSSNYSSKDSLCDDKSKIKYKEIVKNKTVHRKSMSRSRSRSRQNIEYRHHHQHRHHHRDHPIKQSIVDQYRSYENNNEQPMKKQYEFYPDEMMRSSHQRNRSKSPNENRFHHQHHSSLVNNKHELMSGNIDRNHSSSYYSSPHKNNNNFHERDYSYNIKSNDPPYFQVRNDKNRRSIERRDDDFEYARRNNSKERFRDNEYHHSSRPRSADRRPVSRERNKVHSENEDERERYAGDYTSICLKNLNETLRVDDLREHIYNEFKNYRNFSVKIVNNRKTPTSTSLQVSERIAFVNFSNHSDAKHAKKTKANKLFFGYQLYIEPVFRNRSSTIDSGHKNNGSYSSSQKSNMSPPISRSRRRSPSPQLPSKFRPVEYIYQRTRSRTRTPDRSLMIPKNKASYVEVSKSHHSYNISRSRSRSGSLNRLKQPPVLHHHHHHVKRDTYESIPSNAHRESKKEQHREKEERSPKLNSKADKSSNLKMEIDKITTDNKRNEQEAMFLEQNKKPERVLIIENLNKEDPEKKIVLETDKKDLHSSVEFIKENSPLISNPVINQKEANGLNDIDSSLIKQTRRERSPPVKITQKISSRNNSPTNSVSSNSSVMGSRSRSVSSSSSPVKGKKNPISKILKSPSPHIIQDKRNYDYDPHKSDQEKRLKEEFYTHRTRSVSREHRERSYSIEKKKIKTKNEISARISSNNSVIGVSSVSSQRGAVSHYFDNDERDATRTLFVGNLDNQIETKDLKKIFDRYGIVEEIDIKRNQPILPSYQNNNDYFMNSNSSSSKRKTYAFIKYLNMDMAITAKYHLNGTKIGKYNTECKIGYGKFQSTNCLWVGGLTEKTRRLDLENEFEYFALSTIQKSIKASHEPYNRTKMVEINWRPDGELYAYVLFNTISQAEEARNQMRGRHLKNSPSERLRIDFVDPKKFKPVHSHSPPPPPPPMSPLRISSTRSSHSSSIERSKHLSLRYEKNGHSSSSQSRHLRSPDSRLVKVETNTNDKYRKHEASRRSRSPRQRSIDMSDKPKDYREHLVPNYEKTSAEQFSNKRNYSSIRSESTSPIHFNHNVNENRRVFGLSSPKVQSRSSQKSESNNKYLPIDHQQIKESNVSESNPNIRILKKSKPSEPKPLLPGTNLENIIITKTEKTRHVNKVSDLISSNQTDTFKTDVKVQIRPQSSQKVEESNHQIITSQAEKQSNEIKQTVLPSPPLTQPPVINHAIENQLVIQPVSHNQLENKNILEEINLNKEDEKKNLIPEEIIQVSSNNSKSSHKHHHQQRKSDDEKTNDRDEGEICEEEEEKKLETVDRVEIKTSKKSSSSSRHPIDLSKLINESQINRQILNNSLKSVELLANLADDTWSGVFTLKKHIFPTKFYLVAGCKQLAQQILPHQHQQSINNCLRISQRLRLDDPKLDELEKKLYDSNYQISKSDIASFSVLISVPSEQSEPIIENQYHQKSLHNLISYLDQKNAAGVIPLPDDDKPYSMMHAFTPNCRISTKILSQLFPNVKRVISTNNLVNNDFIVIVIFKQNSNNSNTVNN